MAKDPAAALASLIEELSSERAAYIARIEAIDETFAQYGIEPDGHAPGRKKKRRGRKPGPKPGSKRKAGSEIADLKKTSKKKGTRKRATFTKSGEDSVFDFVKKSGQPNAKEVNQHWQKEGRKGKADNALTKLVKEGKLKRVKVAGERGGRYKTA